jgi:ribonucleoside-diphosphate reductase alpha chain
MSAAAARERLPNRRSAETWDVEALGLHFRTTVGRYDDGRIGEIFLSNTRVNSSAGIMASDSAVLCSLLLQHGVSLDVIRKSLMRDSAGKPSGPLAVVLDRIAAEEGTAS